MVTTTISASRSASCGDVSCPECPHGFSFLPRGRRPYDDVGHTRDAEKRTIGQSTPDGKRSPVLLHKIKKLRHESRVAGKIFVFSETGTLPCTTSDQISEEWSAVVTTMVPRMMGWTVQW